jgi:diaminohydroxyphosphoribosylaminopyrimidine deaminase/5-amino-6-(5-phosphoribosylamino)uracil reductase
MGIFVPTVKALDTPEEAATWQAICGVRSACAAGADPRFLDCAGTRVELAADGTWQAATPLEPAQAAMLDLYLPLALAPPDRSFVVAHLGQSLDGRIATTSGRSRWVTGPEDVTHNHRMRALADAIIVGSRTVREDDPQLTVRRCAGDNPVRVVLDPELRLGGEFGVFRDRAARTLVIAAEDDGLGTRRLPSRHHGAEVVRIPRHGDGLSCPALVAALARRGLRWIFIEGGGITVSRFLAAGALDRLQLAISPLILGSGRPGIDLPEIDDPCRGQRPHLRRFELGADMLVECRFGHD